MSAEKCGPVLTAEVIAEAAERAASRGLELPERIIGPRANELLQRIRLKDPGWDNWTVSGEIFMKAYGMGLLQDDE